MKKLLLILFAVTMFSCNNNSILIAAEELYIQGINKKSKSLLENANLKLDMIQEHHSDFDNANMLNIKIDSVLKILDLNTQLRLKRKNDSISEKLAKNLSIKVEILKNIELKKYPNL